MATDSRRRRATADQVVLARDRPSSFETTKPLLPDLESHFEDRVLLFETGQALVLRRVQHRVDLARMSRSREISPGAVGLSLRCDPTTASVAASSHSVAFRRGRAKGRGPWNGLAGVERARSLDGKRRKLSCEGG